MGEFLRKYPYLYDQKANVIKIRKLMNESRLFNFKFTEKDILN